MPTKTHTNRIYDGVLTERERELGRMSGNPTEWNHKYAVSHFLADRLKADPQKILAQPDVFIKIYFGENATAETAYNQTLDYRFQPDKLGDPTMEKAKEAWGGSIADKTLSRYIEATTEMQKQLDNLPGTPGSVVKSGKLLPAAPVRAAQGAQEAGESLAGWTLDKLGASESAKSLRDMKRQREKQWAPTKDQAAVLEQASGSFKLLTTPEFWGITVPRMIGFSGAFVGASMALPAMPGKAFLAAKSTRLARIGESIYRGWTMAPLVAAIESDNLKQDLEDTVELAREMRRQFEDMPPEQLNEVFQKGMPEAYNTYRQIIQNGGNEKIAAQAANGVFFNILKYHMVALPIEMFAGGVAGRGLNRMVKSPAKRQIIQTGLAMLIGQVSEAEEELAENAASEAGMAQAITAEMVDLNLFTPRLFKALTGNDKEAFDTAISVMVTTGRSTVVGALSDIRDARTMAAQDAKLRETRRVVMDAAKTEEATEQTKELAKRLENAKEPEQILEQLEVEARREIDRMMDLVDEASEVEDAANEILKETQIPEIDEARAAEREALNEIIPARRRMQTMAGLPSRTALETMTDWELADEAAIAGIDQGATREETVQALAEARREARAALAPPKQTGKDGREYNSQQLARDAVRKMYVTPEDRQELRDANVNIAPQFLTSDKTFDDYSAIAAMLEEQFPELGVRADSELAEVAQKLFAGQAKQWSSGRDEQTGTTQDDLPVPAGLLSVGDVVDGYVVVDKTDDGEVVAINPDTGERMDMLPNDTAGLESEIGYATKVQLNAAEEQYQPDVLADYPDLQEQADTEQPPNVPFSIAEKAKGATIEEINQVISPMVAAAPTAANTEVKQTADELPPLVLTRARQRFGETAAARIRGVQHEGTIYLVADNIKTADDAAEVWIHEQIAHHGLRAFMGDQNFNQLLQSLIDDMGASRIYEALPDAYKQADQTEAAEEYLAHLAQKVLSKSDMTAEETTAWRKIVNALREMLNRIMGRDTLAERIHASENVTTAEAQRLAQIIRDGIKGVRGMPTTRSRENGTMFAVAPDDYRGDHTAPDSNYGAPGHALSDFYPDDIYGPNGAQYYGHYGQRDPIDRRSIGIIRQMRNKPSQRVAIYRAVPKQGEYQINSGDWVTINPAYAKMHGEHALDGNYKILSKTVRADEIFTDGNSIHEWGYTPRAEQQGQTGDTRFAVTPEDDAEYLAAVEAGDIDAAQEMVDEAAKRAGYNQEAWHYSGRKFKSFDRSFARTSSDIHAFFFKDTRDPYKEYGEHEYRVYIKLTNPANYKQAVDGFNPAETDDAGIRQREKLQSQGFDGAIVSREEGGMDYAEIIAFEPSQIKSADPVTYDDAGNVIPLSERFNEQREDIRFAIEPMQPDRSYIATPLDEKTATTEQVATHNAREYIKELLWDNNLWNEDALDVIADDDASNWEDVEEYLQEAGENRTAEEIYQEQLDFAEAGDPPNDPFDPGGDIMEWAKAAHPATDDLKSAGYVLPDGTLLDFGRRSGAMDHRQLAMPSMRQEVEDIGSTSERMIAFQRAGAMRMDANYGSVDLETMPTRRQLQVIEDIALDYGSANIDLSDGDRTASITVTEDSVKKGIGDIRKFYSGEDIKGGTRFNLAPEEQAKPKRKLRHNDKEHMAAVAIASYIIHGENPTGDDAAAILRPFGLEAKAPEVMQRADEIVKDMEKEKIEFKTDFEMRQVLRTHEIRRHYNQIINKAYKKARTSGEIMQQAKDRLTQARKDKAAAEVRKRTGLRLNELTEYGVDPVESVMNAIMPPKERKRRAVTEKAEEATEAQAEAETETEAGEAATDAEQAEEQQQPEPVEVSPERISTLRRRVKEAVRQKLVKEGRMTLNKRRYDKDPVFQREYQMTWKRILNKAALDLVPSSRRESLRVNIERLADRSTMSGIENAVTRIINKIQDVRTKQTKAQLVKAIRKLLKSPELKGKQSVTTEYQKRKIDPAAESWLKLVKKAASTGKDKADTRIAEIQEQINGEPPANQDEMAWRDALLDEMNALVQYSALQKRTAPELEDTLNSLAVELEFGRKKVEQARKERDARLEKERNVIIAANTPREGSSHSPPVKGRFPTAVADYFTGLYSLKRRFADMMRWGTPEARAQAQKLNETLMDKINEATQRRNTELRTAHEQLDAFIYDTYGNRAFKVAKELYEIREEYRKYSKSDQPLSKSQLIQLYTTITQPEYAEQAKDYDLAAIERELTAEDMALIEYLRQYYDDKREELSDVSKRVTGLPILQPNAIYMPATMNIPRGGLEEIHSVVQIVPKALTPRVKHELDIDETAGVLDVWENRLSEMSQYKAFAELSIELRGIYGNPSVQNQIRATHGDPYNKQLIGHITDIVRGGFPATQQNEAADIFRRYFTLSKLSWNFGVGIKQSTSIPAFAFEIGYRDTAKYVKQAFTEQGVETMKLILRSNQAKNRMHMGNSEAVMNAMRGKSPNMIKRFFLAGMIVNRYGDIVPTLIVGQGIYRSYRAQGLREGMSEDVAHEYALNKLFGIVDSTQQSGQIKDLSEWQRRSSWGRFLGTFTSTLRQFAEFEILDARDVMAKVPGAKGRLAKTILLNHVVLPGLFQGVGLLLRTALGDDPDEDDIKWIIASMLSGPAAGLILFGSLAESAIGYALGESSYGDTLIPAAGALRDIEAGVDVIKGAATLDMDDVANGLNKLMKSNFAPWRDAEKFYRNYIEE